MSPPTMDDGRWTIDDRKPSSIVHRPSSIRYRKGLFHYIMGCINEKGGTRVGDYVQRFMQDQGPLGPHPKHYAGGWIEVICGSMFSGKTEELIRRVKRAQIARQNVQVFKPH